MQPANSKKTSTQTWIIFIGGMLVALCVLCFLGVSLAGAILWYRYDPDVVTPTETPPTAVISQVTPHATTPPALTDTIQPTYTQSPTAPPATLIPVPDILFIPPDEVEQQTVPPRAAADLEMLFNTQYPVHEQFEAAERLSAHKYGERTVTTPAYALGDKQNFIIADGETTIEAALLGITDHTYFWVEDGLDYNVSEVQAIADRLENDYYPRLINLFGQEWQPGVDNDPHFSILHISGESNASELGYFSSTDEYPQTLYTDSNQQEMVYMVMGNLDLGEELYWGTLVHEIQHLIQWYIDPNESTWLNEGLSQLAEIYIGFDTVATIDYIRHPETQLNTWDYETTAVDAHYSGAYLYAVYLWEQLGETAIQELSRHPANGMASIQAILQGYAPERSLSDFTADWVAANFLDNPNAGSRYAYTALDLSTPTFKWRIKELPQEKIFTLDQFGTHYIDLSIYGPVTVKFAGDTTASLFSILPRSGEQIWFAPSQDETNAHLTANFDLTALTSATLTFSAWYDLEKEFDFAYISISTDGGESWELLLPDHTSAGKYGPSYNGRSELENDHLNGWVKESISLNSYVGQPVLIRFDVLTDSAILGQGFAIDDIAIPELGYLDNAENEATWEAKGFVQIGKLLPQKWAVQFIEPEGPTPQVTRLSLNELNQGQWQLEVGKAGGVLAITPLTPYANSPANYWLKIEQ